MKFISISVAFLFCHFTTIGQNSISKKNIDTIKQNTIQQLKTIEHNSETEAYKLLYETTQKNNDTLSETTHWTIGIVIAFIILILGSQFLYNWRLNKQEVDNIKGEMDLKFQELSATLLAERNILLKELEQDISNTKRENQDYLKDKFDTYKESTERTLTANKTELQKEFLVFNADLKKHEADIWLLKGVNQNALSYFIKATEFKIELGQEIKYILGDIVAILKKLDDIHEADYDNLTKLVGVARGKFGDLYDKQLEEVEKNYLDKGIYKFEKNEGGILSGNSLLFSPQLIKKIIRHKKQ